LIEAAPIQIPSGSDQGGGKTRRQAAQSRKRKGSRRNYRTCLGGKEILSGAKKRNSLKNQAEVKVCLSDPGHEEKNNPCWKRWEELEKRKTELSDTRKFPG